MQIFIQLSNEYSYKPLCWPNVTSQSQIHLEWTKPVIPFSKVNYSANHRFTDTVNLPSQCPASYNHQKRSPTVKWWKYTMHIPQRSIILSRKRKIDRTISTYIRKHNSSNILHFTRLTGRLDTTLESGSFTDVISNKKLSYRWQTARCCFVKLLTYCRTFCQTRKVWLPDGEKNSKICLFVLTWSTNVTDGRTDRQTEEQTHTAWQHRQRLHSVAR